MNSSTLGQNIASTGGSAIPIFCLMVSVLSPREDSSAWIRSASHALAALGAVVIVCLCGYFISQKGIGHKWLLGVALFSCVGLFLVHSWVAFDWMTGHSHHVPLWLTTLANSALFVLAAYVFVSRGDLLTTMQRSESLRMAYVTRLEKVEQLAINLEFLTTSQNKKSHELAELIRNVGRAG